MGNRYREAERLAEITQQMGFALLQVQRLEHQAFKFYVLTARAKFGMGLEAAQSLLDELGRHTFGRTVNEMLKANVLPEAIALRFKSLVNERNWLAHESLMESSAAIVNDIAWSRFYNRLEKMVDEANDLLKEICSLTEAFVLKAGVPPEVLHRLIAGVIQEHEQSGGHSRVKGAREI